ncbi:MAG: hypothetical protein ABSG67_19585 [Thermoguttaceae bacterium]
MVIGILDEGSGRIDKYESVTCDKAYVDGHFYSDKAPGLSLAAMPSMATAYGVLKIAGKASFGIDPATNKPTTAFKLLTLIGTIFTSALSTAAAAAALGWLCMRLGCTRGGAIFASLTFALATPTWGWATSFFGHAMAGSCCLLGFALTVYMLESNLHRRAQLAGWIMVGGLLAFSVLVEYTLAVASIIIGLMILWKAAGKGKNHIATALIGLSIGIVPCAILFFAYNYLTFGSLLDFGYKHEVLFPGMNEGYLGISLPKLTALWEILASAKHGILWLSPILILIPLAFWTSLRRRMAPSYVSAALIVVIYFLAMNSSYYYWEGGSSTGPRHITPALGFACFPLGFLWSVAGKKQKILFMCLFALSFFISMACTMVSMNISPNYSYPLFEKLLSDFLIGRFKNVGQFLGIPPILSLVPLALLWAASVWYIAQGLPRVKTYQVISGKLRLYNHTHVGKMQHPSRNMRIEQTAN